MASNSKPQKYRPLPEDPYMQTVRIRYNRPKHPAASPSQPTKYLPEDIVTEILYRLPVESLLRCTSVCKTWHRIITCNSFITNHLAYQKASSKKYILYEGFYSFCSLLSDFASILDGTYKNSKVYYPWELFEEYITYGSKIYGISNGLLCLSKDKYCVGDNIYLYNLGCRKIKKLPRLGIFIKEEYFGCARSNVPGVSFGYYDDDYKVIVIAPVDTYINVYVYSLGNNSWENIHTNFDVGTSYFFTTDTKFVVDTVYAMTSTQVICFNLSDEAIRLVEFPEELCCQHKTIEAFGETVAVFAHDSDHPQFISMWILKDKFSWEKKFTYELQKGCDKAEAIGMLDNGKYLVRTRYDMKDIFKFFSRDFDSAKLTGDSCNFFSCDLDPPKLTEFRPMYADLSHLGCRIHSNYVESLLLLNEVNPDPIWSR